MKTFSLHPALVFIFCVNLMQIASCSSKITEPTRADLESGESGIQLMANYDARFDHIVDNYRILSITFTNQSPNLVELDPKRDIWTITTKAGGKAKAINHLGLHDNPAWNQLSPRAQEVIEYPRIILRNTTVTFDLLFPKTVNLNGFTQIDFYSHFLKKNFIGGTSYGDLTEDEKSG